MLTNVKMLYLHFENYNINMKHKTSYVKHWFPVVDLDLDTDILCFMKRNCESCVNAYSCTIIPHTKSHKQVKE